MKKISVTDCIVIIIVLYILYQMYKKKCEGLENEKKPVSDFIKEDLKPFREDMTEQNSKLFNEYDNINSMDKFISFWVKKHQLMLLVLQNNEDKIKEYFEFARNNVNWDTLTQEDTEELFALCMPTNLDNYVANDVIFLMKKFLQMPISLYITEGGKVIIRQLLARYERQKAKVITQPIEEAPHVEEDIDIGDD